MVYRYSKVIGLILLALLLVVPVGTVLADSPQVDITVAALIIGYPGNFTVTYVNDHQVDISWTNPIGGNNTMVRGAVGRYPTSMTDGYLVYLGNGTSCSDTGVSLDETAALVYYIAWTQNNAGVWSALYSGGSIGGIGMVIIGEAVILLVLLAMIGVGFGFKFPPLMYIVALGGIGIGITLLGTKTALSMEWILGWVFLLVGFVSAFGGYIIQVRQNNEYNQKVDEQIAQDRKDNPLKYMSEEDRYAIEFREAGRRGAELGSQARAKRYMSNLRKGGG